jgi:hypothetical protein
MLRILGNDYYGNISTVYEHRRSFNSFAHTVLYPVQHFYKRIRQTTSGDFDLVIEWRQ